MAPKRGEKIKNFISTGNQPVSCTLYILFISGSAVKKAGPALGVEAFLRKKLLHVACQKVKALPFGSAFYYHKNIFKANRVLLV
ncbi:MAG: hypothetical protein M3Q06_01765 [Bacteroidota bacterium]|nr:hypothetical protein [Bacteroidota bacterium]